MATPASNTIAALVATRVATPLQAIVHTQYDFIRKVTDSASKSLSESDRAKSDGKEEWVADVSRGSSRAGARERDPL